MLKDLLILCSKASEIRGYGGCLYFDFPKQEIRITLFIDKNDKILLEIRHGKNYKDGIYMQTHVDVNKLGYLRRLVSSLEMTEKTLQKY
jgi:hypothetical protein